MSSAKRSRDPPNPGNEPTEELGYPALVQYTFVPNGTESSEILVSEGDIVQLVYKVGGWVFIRTYEGKVGYIPFSFCKELESSKQVGSTYSETGLKGSSFDIPDFGDSNHSKLGNSFTENKFLRRSKSAVGNSERAQFRHQAKSERRVHFADQPKSRNSCDICYNFLTSFSSIEHNTSNVGQKKVNLKPHKLLKLLQTISKEGFVNTGNTRPPNNAQSYFGQITDNRINRRKSDYEFPIKFGNYCNQCDVLKDIFKNANRYSMSDLYSTIRNLHSHALADSDSEEEENSERYDLKEKSSTNAQNGGVHNMAPVENNSNRSISYQDPESKQKVEIVRNNSFSGITDNERSDFTNGTLSSIDTSQSDTRQISTITAVTCTRAAKFTHNKSIDSVQRSPGLQNHKINNFFPENQSSNLCPPLLNGYDEDVTEFRSAEYHPPLVKKWRQANTSLSSESVIKRPPGIIREQTFEFESTRHKEVNFNDPKKENLNLTSSGGDKSLIGKINSPIRSFTMDSRRKPIVSNGDFSLDDDENSSLEPSLSNGSPKGAITKCFTTYGHLTGFQSDVNTGKSLSIDRHSSQFSDRENVDKVEKKHNIESANQDYDNNYSKQTETDSAIDRRKIVARKVNPVIRSPRNLMSNSGPLIGRKNDKDIRKSLLEHSVMKRTQGNPTEMRAQPMRTQPMRAQHDFASQNESASGRTPPVLVKKFNKQMWRPSLAGSEGSSDQRPFSPFGGTLPASKIVKKKVVEVFV
ncbi:uncharacterized protein LOC143075056 [Mytilus galloprovincialis]|uniref:uncharacterized protein LOC143075056 n=1 Tax=Mytilus galloprovincialis TaxID=29158 RepID=UPI003F7C55A0